MNKTLLKFFLLLAGSFACLYLSFSPTVNIPYISHDSIRYFHKFYNRGTDSATYPQYRYEYDLGRPITAELESFLFRKINHLSDMSHLRFITIFIAAVSAFLLAILAVGAGLETVPAFCLSTAIFTLPGVQNFIFVPYVSNTLAIFLTLLAYLILSRPLKFGMNFVLALVLLGISFCIYPPSTLLFFISTGLTLLFGPWEKSKRIWRRDILLWLSAAVINYLTLRIFFYSEMKASGHEIAFTLKNSLWFIQTFLPEGLPQTFNLWNVYYSKMLGFSFIALAAIFIITDFFTSKTIGFKKFGALITIFLLVNSVWFLFGGYAPREFIASQALVLILFYWCGEWIFRMLKINTDLTRRIWAAAWLCFGCLITNQMIASNVLNNYSEFMFLHDRIVQNVTSSTTEIHIIRLKDQTRGYNGLPTVYDDINSTTNDYEIPDLVRVVIKEMPTPFELHCIVSYSNYGEPFDLKPNGIVIDMNDLVFR